MKKLPDRVWKLPRHEDDEAAEEGMGRILALSDGVFAIAITLLILEIAIPATRGHTDLPKALLELWPRYLAYVLSFVVIARFWVTHHPTCVAPGGDRGGVSPKYRAQPGGLPGAWRGLGIASALAAAASAGARKLGSVIT